MRTFFAALIAAAVVLSPGLSEAKRGDGSKGKKVHKKEKHHKSGGRHNRSHFSFSYGHYPDYHYPYYRGHYGPRAGVYFDVAPGFSIMFGTGPRYDKHHHYYHKYPRYYHHGPRYYRHHRHHKHRR